MNTENFFVWTPAEQGVLTPQRPAGTGRGQTTIEMLVLAAIGLVILAVLVDFTAQQIGALQKQREVKTAELAIQNIVEAANGVYLQGPGASRQIQMVWPEGIVSSGTYLSGNDIVVQVFDTQVFGTATPLLTGALPTQSGIQFLRIRAFDGYVALGDLSITSDTPQIYLSMDRDENENVHITLTNSSSEDANITITPDFNNTDLNLAVGPTSGSIAGGDGTFEFDANFSSSAGAVGTYNGKLTLLAEFPTKTETLVIPIQINVLVGQNSSLVTFPSSLSLSTFGADTNSVNMQLCNIGDTSLSTITITPSSGQPGDWVGGFPTIANLDAQSCVNLDVNATVPDAGLGSYNGTLSISDFSGANAISVPFVVSIKGMSSVFNWDWSTAAQGSNNIDGITFANTGTKSITLTHITLRKWWECDSNHANLEQIKMNGSTVFSGSLADGEVGDITDTAIPVLTSYNNNTLTFDDTINDENELFIADVNFSDGTQYTSASYGTGGCGIDTTPPAAVSDLAFFMGPEPGSLRMTFTYPGDDNFSGTAVTPILKYQIGSGALDSNAEWSSASTYGGTIPTQAGGTLGSVVITGFQVGSDIHFNLRFQDENGNMAALSNAVNQRAWNQYSFAGSDFNFSNFASTYNGTPPLGTQDVNMFRFHNLRFVGGMSSGSVAFRVQQTSSPTNQWAMQMDFNGTDVNYYRIWYQAPSNYLQQTPNIQAAVSLAHGGGVNLIDDANISGTWNYDSSTIGLQVPNTFYVDYLVGLSDFNIAFDMSGNGEAWGG